MKVAAVYVRFYRAFNFNFIRKNKDNANPNPWDDYEGMFFPYVKIPLDAEVTSVVGANESGKSQLLYAIECALGIEVAGPDAFCRYSQFFTVDDKLKSPHFGLDLLLDEPERTTLSDALGTPVPRRVFVFREQPGHVRLYVGPDTDPIDRASDDPAITALLPKSFRIHPKKPLPNTVPLDFLVRHADETGTEGDVVSRKARVTVIPEFFAKLGGLRGLVSTAQLKGSDIEPHLPSGTAAAATADELAQWELAYDLLVTVGGVDPSTFTQLLQAVTEQREGFVSGLVASINRQLSAALNLRRWWTQDSGRGSTGQGVGIGPTARLAPLPEKELRSLVSQAARHQAAADNLKWKVAGHDRRLSALAHRDQGIAQAIETFRVRLASATRTLRARPAAPATPSPLRDQPSQAAGRGPPCQHR